MAAASIEPREGSAGLRRLLVPGVLLLALGVLGWFIASQMGQGGSVPKRQTVKIAVLPDTPPPPPPPKEEKRPEPKPEENRPQPQEQKVVEAPPEPQPLKMEGAAGDGPSAFGAGSVSNEYRGGDVGTGGGGTVGDRLAANSYGNAVKREVDNWLQRQPALRRAGDFSLSLHIWVRPDGSIERTRLVGSTGDADTDRAVREALERFPGFRNPPPAGMPQPISLKLSNRRMG